MRDCKRIVESINILGQYLAKRDLIELNQDSLQESFGFRQADLLILFGGSIPYGCDVAARGFLNGVAKNMMIVGGAGHTTDFLRDTVSRANSMGNVEYGTVYYTVVGRNSET